MAFYKNEKGNVDCFVFGSESWSSSGICRWTVCGVIPYYVGEEFIHELSLKFEQFRFLFFQSLQSVLKIWIILQVRFALLGDISNFLSEIVLISILD